jgi:hypothetical protein
MNKRMAVSLLLLLAHYVSAMQVHPTAGVTPKKGLCARIRACLCSCKCRKKEDEREREAWLKETAQIMAEAERKKQDGLREQKRKALLTAKSGTLRAAANLTSDGRHRRTTGNTSDPDHIKQFLKTRKVLTVADTTQLTLDIARSVTPLGGALILPLSSHLQTTARSSAGESIASPTFQQQLSPTPPSQLQHATQ